MRANENSNWFLLVARKQAAPKDRFSSSFSYRAFPASGVFTPRKQERNYLCHPERKGLQTYLSLEVLSRRI